MSIFKSKILTFVIALFCLIPFSLAFVGCGSDTNKNNDPDDNGNNNQNNPAVVTVDAAYNNAVTQLQAAYANATINYQMSYSYGTTPAKSQQGIVKLANGKYYLAELDAQGNVTNYSYIINGKTYNTSDAFFGYDCYDNDGDFDPMSMMNASSVATDLAAYKKIAAFFNPTTPMSVVVVDGKTVLTIGADVATFANKLLANVKANYNTSLTAFLNQLIDDVLGQPALAEGAEVPADRVTVSTLLDTMFANLTDETTFGDVINALPAVLKNRVEAALPYALASFDGMTVEDVKGMPVLSTLDGLLTMGLAMIPNEILSALPFDLEDLREEVLEQGQQPGEGEMVLTANSIKAFIETFLDENSIDSIAGFVMTMMGREVQVQNQVNSQPILDPEPEAQGEEPAAEPGFLDSYIAMLEGASVSKAAFNIVFTFDANNVLTGMDMIAEGAVAMGQVSMGANASMNFQFSNIGTTTIEAPASINYYYESMEMTEEELAEYLNEQTGWYEIELDTIPFAYNAQDTGYVYNEQTGQNVETVVATYDKTTNTVKFLKAYLDQYSWAWLWDTDSPARQYYFYYRLSIEQVPEQAQA